MMQNIGAVFCDECIQIFPIELFPRRDGDGRASVRYPAPFRVELQPAASREACRTLLQKRIMKSALVSAKIKRDLDCMMTHCNWKKEVIDA
jgi:hypothetical protein